MEKKEKLEIAKQIKNDFFKVLQENVTQEDWLEISDFFKGIFKMLNDELFIELLDVRNYPLEFNWNIPKNADKKFNFYLTLEIILYCLDYVNDLLGYYNDKINIY